MASSEGMMDILRKVAEAASKAAGQPVGEQPVTVPLEKPKEAPKKEPQQETTQEAPKIKVPASEEKLLKHIEVIEKEIAAIEAEAGATLSAKEKMSVLRDKFKPESTNLLGGISRLNALDWSATPTHEQWSEIQSILAKMPSIGQLTSETDRAVLQQVHQATYEYYRRNEAALQKIGVQSEIIATVIPLASEKLYDEHVSFEKRMPFEAHTRQQENTKAWADDVAKQVIEGGKHAPLVEVEVTPQEVNNEVVAALAKGDASVDWLVKPGEAIEDPAVAQIVHDVLSAGDLANDREFLFAKGAQLRSLGQGETDAQLRELHKFRARFKTRVIKMYTEDPKFDQGKTHLVENALSEQGGKTPGAANEIPPEYRGCLFSEDLINSLDANRDRDIIQRMRHFNEQLKNDFNNDRGRVLYNFIRDIDHEWTYLSRVVDNAKLLDHVQAIKVKAQRWGDENNERGWSNLYLSYKYMKLSWESPSLAARAMQDEQNMYMGKGTLFPSSAPESVKRKQQTLMAYVTDIDYMTHRKVWLKSLSPQQINELSIAHNINFTVIENDPAHSIENHPWYLEVDEAHPDRINAFKIQLNSEISSAEALPNLYLGVQMGKDSAENKSSYINFGDRGAFIVLNSRPINERMWNMMQRIGREEMLWKENGRIHAPDKRTYDRWRQRAIDEA
jgi:hypothetical protein